jgi:hypothetical protein
MAQLTNGQLIRQEGGNGQVFLVFLGQKCYVPSPQTATNMFGGSWMSYITSVTTGTFNSVPTGTPFTSGTCLVQGAGQQQIYLFTWCKKMWIENLTIQAEYHFNTGNTISNLNAQLIRAMCTGTTINS